MVNSILTVRAIITLAPHFMDLKKDIFRKATCNDAVKALINILDEIDWCNIDFSKVQPFEIDRIIYHLKVTSREKKMIIPSIKKSTDDISVREKGKEKGKEKEKESEEAHLNKKVSEAKDRKEKDSISSIQDDLVQRKHLKNAIRHIIIRINEYNKDRKKYFQIDEYIWARVSKDVIAENDLLNISSQKEKIAYRIFVKQLSCVFMEHLIVVQDASSPDDLVDVMPKILLNYLGSLEKNHKLNEVAAIHNYIHLGYLLSTEAEYCQGKDISMLLAASLLTGFDRKNKVDMPAIIYHGFVKLFEPVFMHEHFSMPYTKNAYEAYRQDPDLFQAELQDLLVNTISDNMIKSLYDCIPLPVPSIEVTKVKRAGPKKLSDHTGSVVPEEAEHAVKNTLRKRFGIFLRNICGAEEVEEEKPVKVKEYRHGNRTSTYAQRKSNASKKTPSKTSSVKQKVKPKSSEAEDLSRTSGESWPTTPLELVEPMTDEGSYIKSTSVPAFDEHGPDLAHRSSEESLPELQPVDGLTPLFLNLALTSDGLDTPPPSSNREPRIGSNSYPGHLRKGVDSEALLLGQQGSGSTRTLGEKLLQSPFIQQDLSTPSISRSN